MTAFVESCVGAVADSAKVVERRTRGHPRARRLLKLLADKKNILVTTHEHPDPDALASSLALTTLLKHHLKDAKLSMSIKGQIGGGLNAGFARLTNLDLLPWDDAALAGYDAIVLLDTQPMWAYSPLPESVMPIAVIDHHRGRGRVPKCAFCDIRSDVGATSSIIFSYFMELETGISGDLAATLLFAIESDLAGAAGTPTELDNIALSSLTLMADTRKLYQMRYVELPQGYYSAYANGLASAAYYDNVIVSHLDTIDSLETPAVIADFLLRFEKVQWALVTAVFGTRLFLSLRTSAPKASAADCMRKLVRTLGMGGGHKAKAGGFIELTTTNPGEIERLREILRRRLLRILKIKGAHAQRLVPKAEAAKPHAAASAEQ